MSPALGAAELPPAADQQKGQRGPRAALRAVELATNLSAPVADKSKGICLSKLSDEEPLGLGVMG